LSQPAPKLCDCGSGKPFEECCGAPAGPGRLVVLCLVLLAVLALGLWTWKNWKPTPDAREVTEYKTVPGIDLARVEPALAQAFLDRANRTKCDCGCNFTVAACRTLSQPPWNHECDRSLPMAQALLAEVTGSPSAAGSPGGSAPPGSSSAPGSPGGSAPPGSPSAPGSPGGSAPPGSSSAAGSPGGSASPGSPSAAGSPGGSASPGGLSPLPPSP
jgi:hypothetical protein